MSTLKNRIDFAVVYRVVNANPNGDPSNGNRPRTFFKDETVIINGKSVIVQKPYGMATPENVKRKARDRWQEDGESILIQPNNSKNDDCGSIRERIEKAGFSFDDEKKLVSQACEKWIDVRAFGCTLAFKNAVTKDNKSKKKNKNKDDAPVSNIESEGSLNDGDDDKDGCSIGVRGPVTFHQVVTVKPINIISTSITRSVNSTGDGKKKGSDTMGQRYVVDDGIYVAFGGMNAHLAKKTGFSEEDAESLLDILPRLFENDESSARPLGSHEILGVVVWRHSSPNPRINTAKLFRSLKVNDNREIEVEQIEGGPKPEILEGVC